MITKCIYYFSIHVLSRGLFTQVRRYINPLLKNGVISIVVIIFGKTGYQNSHKDYIFSGRYTIRKLFFIFFTQVVKVQGYHGNDIEFFFFKLKAFFLRYSKMKNLFFKYRNTLRRKKISSSIINDVSPHIAYDKNKF